MAVEAFSAMVTACDLVATPGSGRTEIRRKVLNRKHRVSLLLRKRLETGEPASDQVIMTMFFLLTLDVGIGQPNSLLLPLNRGIAIRRYRKLDTYLGYTPPRDSKAR